MRWSRIVLAVALVFVAVPLSPVAYSFWLCPDMAWYTTHLPKRTSFMLRAERAAKAAGKPFALRYTPIPMEQMPLFLQRAVVRTEDDGFHQHHGFDLAAMKLAWEQIQKTGKIRHGGSTISQQLAKNIWLSPERSYLRKGFEAILTWRMERTLSKRRILEIYLNVIEWGNGVYGIQEAALFHFGCVPSQLTERQIALLVAAIPSPRRSNPGRPGEYLLRRQAEILGRMGR